MDTIGTISIVKDIMYCIKCGMDIVSKVSEHYEKHDKNMLGKTRGLVSCNCDVVEINTRQVVPNYGGTYKGVLIFMSEQLYDSGVHRNPAFQSCNMKLKFFEDGERLDQLSSAVLEHAKESIVVIRSNCKNKKLALQLEILNIVPGNDNLCYRILCNAKCGFMDGNYKRAVNELLEDVMAETVQIYEKYQKSVAESLERLELETRILANLGYTDIAYKPVTMGYGLEFQMGKKRLIVGIPYEYPQKAPTVVLMHKNSYQNIELSSSWEPFMTIGHILKAVEKGV